MVIFLGGIGLNDFGIVFLIFVVVGVLCGILVGWLLFKGCSLVGFKWFFLFLIVLFFLIFVGFFVGFVYELEEYMDNEYFIWKMNCCS